MAGIYIHIPFCKKACVYCDFHFSTSLDAKNNFLTALKSEIQLRQNYLSEKVHTVYFGGGTPSVLTAPEINGVFDELQKVFNLTSVTEITLEANPDDLSKPYLEALKQTPVNRLSVGVQSFRNERLSWMNRTHTAAQSISAIEHAAALGFNLSMDLIFSLPEMTPTEWNEQLQMVTTLPINHLSAYGLTVEKGTLLFNRVKSNQENELPDDLAQDLFLQGDAFLTQAGFEHYEISNYAKPGFRAQHNSNYWYYKPYLGLGPSAHSFNLHQRQWNVSNNALYIKSLSDHKLPLTSEDLTATEKFNEYLMVGLRTKNGISMSFIEEFFGKTYAIHFIKEAFKPLQKKILQKQDDVISIPVTHWFMADKIISDLFYI